MAIALRGDLSAVKWIRAISDVSQIFEMARCN